VGDREVAVEIDAQAAAVAAAGAVPAPPPGAQIGLDRGVAVGVEHRRDHDAAIRRRRGGQRGGQRPRDLDADPLDRVDAGHHQRRRPARAERLRADRPPAAGRADRQAGVELGQPAVPGGQRAGRGHRAP
jgi:hypothetical protein